MKISSAPAPASPLRPTPAPRTAEAARPETVDHVATADFPPFVAELISGVFEAVVDASVQQMKAYEDLLASATKSVDEFREDNVEDPEETRERDDP